MTENNTSKKIDPGAGYRLLESHEVIREGDAICCEGNTEGWQYISGTREVVGVSVSMARKHAGCAECAYRRPIRLDPSDPNYRLLDEGEIIGASDEQETAIGWTSYSPQVYAGSAVYAFKWRRRIEIAPKAEPERFVPEYDDTEYVEVPMTRLERVAAGLELDPYDKFGRNRFVFPHLDEIAAQNKADIARILRGKSEAEVIIDDMTGSDL